MRAKWCIGLFVLTVGAMSAAAQRGPEGSSTAEQFLGTWSGTWDGAGSGGFELTLEKTQDGALAGKVAVTGEPTYNTILKTVSFDGAKMAARYDFPPDEAAEVVLSATFEARTAKGTWSVREKASGSEVAAGTWNVTRK